MHTAAASLCVVLRALPKLGAIGSQITPVLQWTLDLPTVLASLFCSIVELLHDYRGRFSKVQVSTCGVLTKKLPDLEGLNGL